MANSRDEEVDIKYKQLPLFLKTAGEFLIEAANILNWEDLSNSIVMDVGCGVTSLKLFSTIFPNFKGVIAIDISSPVIEDIKIICKKHEKMHYHVADITDRSTLKEWEAKMPKIASFFCFNCLTDQKAGFANIHYLLQPGGEAIIVTVLKSPHYECAKYLLQKPKWNTYKHLEKKFTNFQAHGTGISFYQNILNDLDFEIISCKEVPSISTFTSEEKFRDSPLTKDLVVGKNLPENVRKEFEEEYVQTLIELNGRAPSGELCLQSSTARIIIRRKK